MTDPQHTLVSSDICPFVQWAHIVSNLKGIDAEVRYIDLDNKPEWVLAGPFPDVLRRLSQLVAALGQDQITPSQNSARARRLEGLTCGTERSFPLMNRTAALIGEHAESAWRACEIPYRARKRYWTR